MQDTPQQPNQGGNVPQSGSIFRAQPSTTSPSIGQAPPQPMTPRPSQLPSTPPQQPVNAPAPAPAPKPVHTQEDRVPVPPTPVKQASAPPPPPPPKHPAFFDVFSLVPFLIGFVVIALLVFVGIKFIPGLLQNTFQKQSNEPVTITYWGLWEDPNVVSTVLADFEREQPNIKVDYRKWDVKQYRETLTSRIQQDIGPDVFRFHNSWLPMFKDLLLPLPQDVANTQDIKTIYPNVVIDDLEEGGAIYGTAQSVDTLALFINEDLFSQAGQSPPTTWEELSSVATNLTVVDESGKIQTAGVALGTFDNINHASDIISLMVLQNYGSLLNTEAGSQEAKNAQDALCFYVSFAKNNSSECSRGGSFIWDDTLDTSLLSFTKGNLAMYFGYSWDVFTIQMVNPNLKFRVVPVPQLPNQNLTVASYWPDGISKKSKHQKEALELIKFLSRKETAQRLYAEQAKTRLFGEPYARLDLTDTLKDQPIASVFVNQAKTAVSTPFASDTFDNGLNTELNGYLGDSVRSLMGNTSLKSAYETFLNGVSTTKQKYGLK